MKTRFPDDNTAPVIEQLRVLANEMSKMQENWRKRSGCCRATQHLYDKITRLEMHTGGSLVPVRLHFLGVTVHTA